LNTQLSSAQYEKDRLEKENQSLIQAKQFEANKLKDESSRLCDELHFERRSKMENLSLDKIHNEGIKEMDLSNDYWKKKYATLDHEKSQALLAAQRSKNELNEVKEIINR